MHIEKENLLRYKDRNNHWRENMLNIKTVTVIGANGAMGSLVAGIFASFGMANVFLISRTIEKSNKAIEKAVESVRADSIRERLIPKTFEDIPECVSKSDWVFESVAEDLKVKEQINKLISKYRRPGTIVTTGSSGLSIEYLKESFSSEGRSLYLGTHFFNPPYTLQLCEIVTQSNNNNAIIFQIKEYLEIQLRRKTVLLKNSPAFLANRIGFMFLNEVLQLAEKYKDDGGLDYIDAIFGPFTGRGMTPIDTIDFVGLDVHKAIVDNLYENTNDFAHESFYMPSYVKKLIENGSLGRKTGSGLYKITKDKNGNKNILVYDILTGTYREKRKYKLHFAEKLVNHLNVSNYSTYSKILLNDSSKEANICKTYLIKYLIYAMKVTTEISRDVYDCDIVMSYGFNWAPPTSLIKLLGGKSSIIREIETNKELNKICKKVDIEELLNNYAGNSPIDYKKYYRAKI